MTMFRMPIFTWNTLITSLLAILVFPILTAALFGLLADRNLGALVYTDEMGGPMLWQHLFWYFGHPEVYIIALPFFGIITEIIPVFSRKPLFGYKGMVGATLAIGFLSLAVWAHHMFATGAVLLPFFAFLTYLIAVPTGLKFFNWIGTMWRGQLTFETPMLWSIGFLVTFLLGGLTGVLLASPPLDWHVTDSYFVVAHFHYVVFGTVVFAANAGIAFWFPKMCGRMMDERLGKLQFWMTFIGFHGTFLIQHWLGNEGMPRRYVDYLATDGFTTLNMISTIFSFVLGASIIPFLFNVTRSWKYGRLALRRRPVGPRQLAGVGDVVPAAAAQLPGDPEDPLGAAGVRGALPGAHRSAAGRGPCRQVAHALRGQRRHGRDRPSTGPARPRRDLDAAPCRVPPRACSGEQALLVLVEVVEAGDLRESRRRRRRAPRAPRPRPGRRCSPCGPACPSAAGSPSPGRDGASPSPCGRPGGARRRVRRRHRRPGPPRRRPRGRRPWPAAPRSAPVGPAHGRPVGS